MSPLDAILALFSAKKLKEIIPLLWPIFQQVLRAFKDAEIRAIAHELKNAKTPEEKRDAARKIADALYKH